MRIKIIVAVIVIGLLAGAYVSTTASIKEKLAGQLSAAIRRPVKIAEAELVLPAGMRIKGLVVPPIQRETEPPLAIREIHAQLILEDMFQSDPLGDLDVVGPKFSLEWSRELAQMLSQFSSRGGIGSLQLPGVPIRRLKVREGEVNLVDVQQTPSVDWLIRQLEMGFGPDPAGLEQVREFYAKGVLIDRVGQAVGSFEIEGTVIAEGPVELSLLLEHGAIQLLAPYLKKALGPAPVRGRLDLHSRMTIQEGVLLSHNQVSASDVAFVTDQPTTLGPDGNRLVELLSDEQGRFQVGFVVKGRLGEPLDWSDLAAGALREAMRKALARSIQKVMIQSETVGPLEEQLRQQLDASGR